MSEELQNYNFPLYPAEPLVKRAPRLDSEGIDLVSKFLLYEARKRVSAKDAMHHSYFASLGHGVYNLLDGKTIELCSSSSTSHHFRAQWKLEENHAKNCELPLFFPTDSHP